MGFELEEVRGGGGGQLFSDDEDQVSIPVTTRIIRMKYGKDMGVLL